MTTTQRELAERLLAAADDKEMTVKVLNGDHRVVCPAALLREAAAALSVPSADVETPLFGDPDSLLAFLEQAGAGCISGHVTEWPQLKPACRWAAQEIKRLQSAIAPTRHAVTCKMFQDPYDEREPAGPCTCGATDRNTDEEERRRQAYHRDVGAWEPSK